jgi:N-glycosylase/DNA lyase
MNKDQKGDLVEDFIFNAFKDKCLRSSEAFYQLVKRDYNCSVSSGLYRRIVNYQIMRYGESLYNVQQREYQKYFSQREPRSVRRRWQRNYAKVKEERTIERIEKNKHKKSLKDKKTK